MCAGGYHIGENSYRRWKRNALNFNNDSLKKDRFLSVSLKTRPGAYLRILMLRQTFNTQQRKWSHIQGQINTNSYKLGWPSHQSLSTTVCLEVRQWTSWKRKLVFSNNHMCQPLSHRFFTTEVIVSFSLHFWQVAITIPINSTVISKNWIPALTSATPESRLFPQDHTMSFS